MDAACYVGRLRGARYDIKGPEARSDRKRESCCRNRFGVNGLHVSFVHLMLPDMNYDVLYRGFTHPAPLLSNAGGRRLRIWPDTPMALQCY